MAKASEMQTITMKTVKRIAVSCDLEDDGTLAIKSNLSAAKTKALIPHLFPAWMFEGKGVKRVTLKGREVKRVKS